jgi:hypothetical protein
MSYNLPNSLTPKTRNFGLRKITNFWPLLVWIGAIFAAFWAYKQGVVFRRFNGAVDVQQENVSPFEEGNFDKLADGIYRGGSVKAGQVVGYMRDIVLKEKIDILKQEINTRRTERLRHFDEDLLKMESELRKIKTDLRTSEAEQDACEEEIKLIGQAADAMGTKGPLSPSAQSARDAYVNNLGASFKIKLSKSKALATASAEELKEVNKQYQVIKAERQALAEIKDEKLFAERNQAAQLTQLEHRVERLTLKATRDGTVDLILKEPGEFVKQGEGILKIVGAPNQIVGFLAQDQLGQIKKDAKVYLTSTKDRATVYTSKVEFLAPRMNSFKDSSGATGGRIFGRDVICSYPKDSGLLPGQTIIIWLEPPGDVPWINKLLTNDDAATGK